MTMALSIFSKMTSSNEKENKSKLEYKLYLARENPEPMFDLTECNLKSVPPGTYSLCKVFRKESLLLQSNCLTSLSGGGNLFDLHLLKVLNLSKNFFLKIPDDLSCLISLEELNLSSNELKKLPESIGLLLKLKIFDCSYNKLKHVPRSLGKLTYLTNLDLRYNPNLSSIPSEISHLKNLHRLFIDENVLTDIPIKLNVKEEHAVNFDNLCQKSGKSNTGATCKEGIGIESSFELFGRKKDEKLQKLLEVERNIQEQKDIEFQIHNNHRQNKSKLLDILKAQEQKLEHDVITFHNQKEQERAKLIDNLLDNAMESLVIEEHVIKNSQNMRQNALQAMETEMDSQKALVATLLERSDLRSQNLVLQMALLQQQLAVLTAVEIERKSLNKQDHTSFLDEKRKTLSDLLVKVLQDQGDRHEQVLRTLQNFESGVQSSENNSTFWGKQYQRLLDDGPQQLKDSVDVDLVHQFVVNGVSHYLPLIVNLDMYSITDTLLDAIGIKHLCDKEAVIKAVNAYIAQKQVQFTPSAPPDIDEASAPPAPETDTRLECVICMERECAIVFVPCGHYCTCTNCASFITICPLCRALLERKIHIIIS